MLERGRGRAVRGRNVASYATEKELPQIMSVMSANVGNKYEVSKQRMHCENIVVVRQLTY